MQLSNRNARRVSIETNDFLTCQRLHCTRFHLDLFPYYTYRTLYSGFINNNSSGTILQRREHQISFLPPRSQLDRMSRINYINIISSRHNRPKSAVCIYIFSYICGNFLTNPHSFIFLPPLIYIATAYYSYIYIYARFHSTLQREREKKKETVVVVVVDIVQRGKLQYRREENRIYIRARFSSYI